MHLTGMLFLSLRIIKAQCIIILLQLTYPGSGPCISVIISWHVRFHHFLWCICLEQQTADKCEMIRLSNKTC